MANRKNPFLGKRTVGHHVLDADELTHVDALRRLGTPEEVISDMLDRLNREIFDEARAIMQIMEASQRADARKKQKPTKKAKAMAAKPRSPRKKPCRK